MTGSALGIENNVPFDYYYSIWKHIIGHHHVNQTNESFDIGLILVKCMILCFVCVLTVVCYLLVWGPSFESDTVSVHCWISLPFFIYPNGLIPVKEIINSEFHTPSNKCLMINSACFFNLRSVAIATIAYHYAIFTNECKLSIEQLHNQSLYLIWHDDNRENVNRNGRPSPRTIDGALFKLSIIHSVHFFLPLSLLVNKVIRNFCLNDKALNDSVSLTVGYGNLHNYSTELHAYNLWSMINRP